MDIQYTGYQIKQLNEEDLNRLYNGTYNAEGFKVNEYLIVENKDDVIDYFCWNGEKFQQVRFPIIKNSYTTVKPRNPQQHCAINLLQNRDSKIKVLRGVYGSGKDYLMLYEALSLIEEEKFDKIVFVRPHIGIANMPDIGSLPGTAEEKLSWTLAPFYDKVGGEYGVAQLLKEEKLQLVPINFIRGYSFNNSIVYITEGQNMTKEIVKLLIGRIGENSELWINADNHQVDKRIFEHDNGVTAMINKFSGNKLFGYIYLPTTERSDVARLADLLD